MLAANAHKVSFIIHRFCVPFLLHVLIPSSKCHGDGNTTATFLIVSLLRPESSPLFLVFPVLLLDVFSYAHYCMQTLTCTRSTEASREFCLQKVIWSGLLCWNAARILWGCIKDLRSKINMTGLAHTRSIYDLTTASQSNPARAIHLTLKRCSKFSSNSKIAATLPHR